MTSQAPAAGNPQETTTPSGGSSGDIGTVSVIIVVSSDLGGRFVDSDKVVERLRADDSFSNASTGTRFDGRLQLSYRHGNEPEVVAARETVDLRLDSWQGQASQLITIHPSGIITIELEIPVARSALGDCTKIEDDVEAAMRVLYIPHVSAAYNVTRIADRSREGEGSHDDRGVDFISSPERIRQLVGDCLILRPNRYPGIDMRVVVSVLCDDIDVEGPRLISQFVNARQVRSQSTIGTVVQSDQLFIDQPHITAHRWNSLLYVSCDTDAALVVSRDESARRIGNDCLTMAQKMWFLSRTWAGVLDQMGTLGVEGDIVERETLRAMERTVIEMSTLEYEIARSMTTLEAAGIMLRDTWHVELVELAMTTLGIESQRRLIDRRTQALVRNHDTVAELLDRSHQNEVRAQADRLSGLFAVSVATSITALIPALVALNVQAIYIVTLMVTILIWAGLAWWIWKSSRAPIHLAPRSGSVGRLRSLGRVTRRSRQ